METPLSPSAPTEAPATVADKLQNTLNAQASSFNKLNGITHAAIRIEEARDVLLGPQVGFTTTDADIVFLDKVLTNLATYA
jgi:hypothetical protein